MNPIDVYKAAVKSVPAIKFALGVAGIVAIVSIIPSFAINYEVALVGTVCMFILMVMLVLFANLVSVAKNTNPHWAKIFLIPIQFMLWAFLLIMIASSLLLFTWVFFQWPPHLGPADSRITVNGDSARGPLTDSGGAEPVNTEKHFRVSGANHALFKKLIDEKADGFTISDTSGNIVHVTFSGQLRKSIRDGLFWYPGGKIKVTFKNNTCFELDAPKLRPTHKLGSARQDVVAAVESQITTIIETDTSAREKLATEIARCLEF